MARCPHCEKRFPLWRLLGLRLREEVACPECGHRVRLSYWAYLLDALIIAGVVYLLECWHQSSAPWGQAAGALIVMLAILSWSVSLRCRNRRPCRPGGHELQHGRQQQDSRA